MTTTASIAALDSSCQAHDQEARLLVELLRTSRLTLLFGETGSDKTALLKLGLMPLLCRRTGDRLVPAAVRESGVVVPFPDRRSRSSARASKRRREIVVYFDDWTDTPLAALRASIHQTAATSPAERSAPLVRLCEILGVLGGRLDANFIILLDRFEEFLRTPSHRVDIAQFANELVEAINQAQLPANFLISLNEEARPRLASLRSRIPGFDNFSLKLTRPQGYKPAAAPVRLPPEPPDPVVIEAPPVLTEVLPALTTGSTPARNAAAAPAICSAAKPKVKRPPRPRVEIKTEDVYALIEATLSRIAPGVSSEPFLSEKPVGPAWVDNGHVPARQAQAAVSQPPGLSESPALTPRKNLQAAVDWVGRHLGPKPKPKPKQGA